MALPSDDGCKGKRFFFVIEASAPLLFFVTIEAQR